PRGCRGCEIRLLLRLMDFEQGLVPTRPATALQKMLVLPLGKRRCPFKRGPYSLLYDLLPEPRGQRVQGFSLRQTLSLVRWDHMFRMAHLETAVEDFETATHQSPLTQRQLLFQPATIRPEEGEVHVLLAVGA